MCHAQLSVFQFISKLHILGLVNSAFGSSITKEHEYDSVRYVQADKMQEQRRNPHLKNVVEMGAEDPRDFLEVTTKKVGHRLRMPYTLGSAVLQNAKVKMKNHEKMRKVWILIV